MEEKPSIHERNEIPTKQKEEEGWCIFLVIYATLTQKSEGQA